MDTPRKFLVFKKIDTGLLFERILDVVSTNPIDLSTELAGNEYGKIAFDYRERVKIETETFVFEEDGYKE